jgi:hypothetical protein
MDDANNGSPGYEAMKYVYSKGLIRHSKLRSAIKQAYIDGFKQGAREGWMRCGAYNIGSGFESDGHQQKEIEDRWPME